MTAENRLRYEKSPYLLQHAENPIHWFAWGEDALETARDLDRPIFLSIGYSSCHWCHVMEHESFEDTAVANILNANFVSIKVDREERPDIDEIYMTACQAMTQGGGWPLTIIMTPDGKPFWAGTYIPRTARFGRPGLIDLLTEIGNKWTTDRPNMIALGDRLEQHLQSLSTGGPGQTPGLSFLRAAVEQTKARFDGNNAGYGGAPKFPMPHRLTALIRWLSREDDPVLLDQVKRTLRAMRWGGMYDQLGFGFHRYSTDPKWLVPHFEKMLYDNAGLAIAYTEMYQLTGETEWRTVAEEIFTYILRDMTDPDGGFYSAEDADSEGEEGIFYIWGAGEFDGVLDRPAANLTRRFWGVTERGNFENSGKTILFKSRSVEDFAAELNRPASEVRAELEAARAKLFDHREKREHPFKDDKVITSWNGLMIAAMAKAGQAFDDRRYVDAAEKAARFILAELRDDDGRLLRRYRDGEAKIPAFSDDYAFLVWALIELYEATFDVTHLTEALALNDDMLRLFWDDDQGGLFFYGTDSEKLLIRPKEYYDGALPSANSVAALNLLRLARLTGKTELEERADKLLQSYAAHMQRGPGNFMQGWWAVDFAAGPSQEIVISGDDGGDFARELRRRYLPRKVLLGRAGDIGPIGKIASYVEPLSPVDGKTAVYVCENYQCRLPVTGLEALDDVLAGARVSAGQR